ncbi:hemicentin-2, partial [Biomphalaria glabrata]
MAPNLNTTLLLFYVLIGYIIHVLAAQEKPTLFTPSKYYVPVGGVAKLPCMAASSQDTLTWFSKREDAYLKSRSRTVVDPVDRKLSLKIIDKIQLTDSGHYVCSDGKKNQTIELIVVNPSEPLHVTAKMVRQHEAIIKWNPPKRHANLVKTYRLFVTDTSTNRTKEFEDTKTKPNKAGEFLLQDLFPDKIYEISVAPTFMEGTNELPSMFYGPKSKIARLDTTKLDAAVPGVPMKVEAEPGFNSSILVKWLPPKPLHSGDTYNFKVFYEGFGKHKSKGQVLVESPNEEDMWEAVLTDLPIKMKYKIEVAALTKGPSPVMGPKSKTLDYRHDGFTPEISLNAVPLTPDTILVTLDTVGDAVVEVLRVLYSDASAIDWKRLDEFDEKQGYGVITGLKPNSSYFFMAKARVSTRPRQTVTHAVTPSFDLPLPSEVKVIAKSDTSAQVSWSTSDRSKLKGHIVIVQRLVDDNTIETIKQLAVLEDTEVLVKDLMTNEKYQVQVIPFSTQDRGACSEAVRFQLGTSDVETTTKALEWKSPNFVESPPEELNINEGDEVKIVCAAEGVPTPSVQWLKDNDVIGFAAMERNELTLPSVFEPMVLMCRAWNNLSVIESKVNVKVMPKSKAPSFTDGQPEYVDVSHGESIRVVCEASGVPLPTVQWYKNDYSITSKVPSRAEYTLSRITESTELECRASNSQGQISKKVFITMQDDSSKAPTFIDGQPQRTEVPKGENYTAYCEAEGVPEPYVQLFQDGAPLVSRKPKRAMFVISGVSESMELECRAENRLGKISKKLYIYVYDLQDMKGPSFKDKLPKELFVNSGEKLKVDCAADGVPTPTIQWYVDRLPYGRPEHGRMDLQIQNVDKPVVLTCVARNNAGTIHQRVSVKLKPSAQPPSFIDAQPERVQAYKGDDVLVTCEATGIPEPSILWLHENSDLSPVSARKADYTIKQIPRSIELECRASNTYGQISKKVYIDVEDKPEKKAPSFVELPPEEVILKEGGELKVVCAADGVPPPRVYWLKDGVPIGDTALERNELIIASVLESVEFTCIAENPMRSIERKVIVKVQSTSDEPRFTDSQPEKVEAFKGEDVQVICQATGVPQPTVQWFLKGSPVTGKKKSRVEYVVSSVIVPTVLECRAENSLGQNSKKVIISVPSDPAGRSKPIILDTLPSVVEVESGKSLTLKCQGWGEPMPGIEWFKNQSPVRGLRLGDDALELHEKSVTENVTLYCRVSNRHGSEDHVVNVVVIEPYQSPILVSKIPRQIEKFYGDSLTIPCEFHGRPVPRVTWFNDTTLLVKAKPKSNTLNIPFVTESSFLRCRGENVAGMGETSVMLNVKYRPVTPKSTTLRPPPVLTHVVRIESSMVSPKLMVVKWIVDQGDLSQIGYFNLTTFSQGQIVMSQLIGSNHRSLNLKSVETGNRYLVLIETYGRHGSVLANSTHDIVVPPYTPPSSPPCLKLELTEIRDTSVKYEMVPVNFNTEAYEYRVAFYDLGTKWDKRSWFDRKSPDPTPLSVIDNLRPSHPYQIHVELLSKSQQSILNITYSFQTAPKGGYLDPIKLVAYLHPMTLWPTTATSTLTTTGSTESDITNFTASIGLSTEISSSEAIDPLTLTTVPVTSASSVTISTTDTNMTDTDMTTGVITTLGTTVSTVFDATTEDPIDETYLVSSKTRFKSPNNAVIIWQVDQGNLENIKHFNVALFDSKGRKRLASEVAGNQRYINIHPLPNGIYVVNINAKGDEGELFQHNITVVVPPMSMDADSQTPRLDLEANEVRSTDVNIVWDVFNMPPNAINGYRVQVFEEGPKGLNLMNKTLNANTGTLRISNLSPNKRYHVVVDALDVDAQVNMTASVTFDTPPHKRYGKAVKGAMRVMSQPQIALTTLEPEMPQMDMSISKSKTQIQDEENPVHDIKWSLKNFHDYVISNYSLKVRLDGLNGELLYDETFPPNIRYFLMEGMTSGRVYYVEVNALSALGLPLISVGTEYNPDESPDPLTVSQPLLPLTTTTVAATKKPVKLELHVRSLGDDELVMNWSLEDSNTKNDIAMFIIKAKDHEDEYLILDTWTDNETWEYKLKKVLDYRRYNFMVQAVDVNNNTLADAYETIDIPSGEEAAFSLPISTIPSPMEPIELDLRLQSLRSNGTSMYWTLQDPDNRVQQFRITVQEMDENGDIVYDILVKRDSQEYLVEQLEENGKYYFILEALDAFNNTLASDNETYIVSFSDDIQEDTTTTNGNFNENTATESAENNQ